MLSAPPLDNCLVITGQVANLSPLRYSPAGLPILRFTLEHHSQQREADTPREARCRLAVMACGTRLIQRSQPLTTGQQVRVRGFLSRADHRFGEARLVLHAEHIELLDAAPPAATA